MRGRMVIGINVNAKLPITDYSYHRSLYVLT